MSRAPRPQADNAKRLALVDDGLPDGRGDFRAHAQFETVFAGVARAADDAALPMGAGCSNWTRVPR